jgi:hypothetical protein
MESMPDHPSQPHQPAGSKQTQTQNVSGLAPAVRTARSRMPAERAIPLTARLFGWTAVIVTPFGCASIGPSNPAITLSGADIRAERDRMASSPVPLERPVLVLSGYRALPSLAGRLRNDIVELTSGQPEDFHVISYTFGNDIHTLAELAVTQLEAKWPSDDPDQTIEVDVLAISMGGLVARLAALPPDERPPDARPVRTETSTTPPPTKRLRINRLMTFGTPHQGAKLAEYITLDNASLAMQPGSQFLQELNKSWPRTEYQLIPYAHLNDGWVGATRAAPPGEDPIWDRGKAVFSHFLVSYNPLFIADASRRLRGEEPLIDVRTPPPSD